MNSITHFIRSNLQLSPDENSIEHSRMNDRPQPLAQVDKGGQCRSPAIYAAGAKDRQGEKQSNNCVLTKLGKTRWKGSEEANSVCSLRLREVSVRESSSPSTAVSQRLNF